MIHKELIGGTCPLWIYPAHFASAPGLLGMMRFRCQPHLIRADMRQFVDLSCSKQHHMVDPVMDVDSQVGHLVFLPNGMPSTSTVLTVGGNYSADAPVSLVYI